MNQFHVVASQPAVGKENWPAPLPYHTGIKSWQLLERKPFALDDDPVFASPNHHLQSEDGTPTRPFASKMDTCAVEITNFNGKKFQAVMTNNDDVSNSFDLFIVGSRAQAYNEAKRLRIEEIKSALADMASC